MTSVYALVRVFIVMERHDDRGNSYKGKHLIGAGLQFRGLVQYCLGGKYGNIQAHKMLEK